MSIRGHLSRLSRGDQREDIFFDDVDLAPEERLLAYPWKLALAVRLRQETTLSVKEIAGCLSLGKPKGARINLLNS